MIRVYNKLDILVEVHSYLSSYNIDYSKNKQRSEDDSAELRVAYTSCIILYSLTGKCYNIIMSERPYWNKQ